MQADVKLEFQNASVDFKCTKYLHVSMKVGNPPLS